MVSEKDLRAVKQMLDQAESNIRQAKILLFSAELADKASSLNAQSDVIEGIFDGEKMIGPDKRIFDVPANYASKSKLVAGDRLKLTILDDGSFIYKQIGPVERKKKVGTLAALADGRFSVACRNNEEYQVLAASVTYFKAQAGDKLSILIPDGVPSEWAAVENLIMPNG